MDPILELKHIDYSYHTPEGETKALTDISFDVYPGEFVAVIGPSGCGKSTLLSIISGLFSPESGMIKINGSSSNNCPANIGYMLQHDHLFEWRTIYKNVILGLEIQHTLTARTHQKAHDLLQTYGLEQFSNAHPSELSGGMRQRAALIRTLVLEPDLLLLDEPFSALDYQTRLKVSDDIGQILRKEMKTAILVTHDLSEAVSLADRIIILTKRPAQINTIIPVTFPSEITTPMLRRNAPEFKTYFNLIWKELNDSESSEKQITSAKKRFDSKNLSSQNIHPQKTSEKEVNENE